MNAIFTPSRTERGGYFKSDSLTFIPEDTRLRCLRDQLIVEPIDVVFSRYLVVPCGEPIRGICRVAGPGVFPPQYDHPEKHKRTKMWAGMGFRPTETQVGDVIWFGGLERTYTFEQFWWGDILHIHCRDEDVVGVEM